MANQPILLEKGKQKMKELIMNLISLANSYTVMMIIYINQAIFRITNSY